VRSYELRSDSVFENVDVLSNTALYIRDNIFASALDKYFAYSSPYSGAFDLAETIKYPRMCASGSINMTGGNGTGGV
jgi:hypothetical protein